jgi:hypothetical protein
MARQVQRADVDSPNRNGLSNAGREELARLQRQVRVLEEERSILKKAAPFFAKETGAADRGRIYLARMLKCFSRRAVGLGRRPITCAPSCRWRPWKMAPAAVHPQRHLLHHTDRGCLYPPRRIHRVSRATASAPASGRSALPRGALSLNTSRSSTTASAMTLDNLRPAD